MGCSQSKDATTPDSDRPDTLRSTTMAQEAKSRLEWKMCQVIKKMMMFLFFPGEFYKFCLILS